MFLHICANDIFNISNALQKFENYKETELTIILKSNKYICDIVEKLLKFNNIKISISIHIPNISSSIFKLVNIEELMIHSFLNTKNVNKVIKGLYKLPNLKLFMIGNNSFVNYLDEKTNISNLYVI